jgi:hypothetical protein
MTQTIIKKPAEVISLLTKLKSGSTMDFKATKLPSGEIVVTTAAPPKTKEQLLQEPKYKALENQEISLSRAATKYGVSRSVISQWVYVTGDVHFTNEAVYPKLVSEAEVALCADIYHERKKTGTAGLPYFDAEGYRITEVKRPISSRPGYQKSRKAA